jgi:hypothetical protein
LMGSASNYRRRVSRPGARHGCLKAGQMPFNSGTAVMLRRRPPIKRI